MAETAIGASFPERGAGLRCDTVDREVLERSRVAKPVEIIDPDDLAVRARRLPMLGTAVPGMEDGEILKIIATDRGSIVDFPAWCEDTGNELLEWHEGDDGLVFFIKKVEEED